jgi:hypothetical protein
LETKAAPRKNPPAPREKNLRLADAQDNYHYHTGKASDVGRQLALAGIAVVWIVLTAGVGDGLPISVSDWDMPLMLLLLFATVLALDVLHYVYAGAAWGIYQFRQRTKWNESETIEEAPGFINWITIGLYAIKLLLLGATYALLFWWFVGLATSLPA